jgi:hypothetical protein
MFKKFTFLFLFLTGFSLNAQVSPEEDLLVIRISETALEQELQYFVSKAQERDVKLIFEEVVRSSTGKITAISIQYSIPEGKSGSFEFANAKGIGPVLIKIEKEGKIGFLSGEEVQNSSSRRSFILHKENVAYYDKPLIIIDGKIQAPDFELASIAPEDIQKMTVLKQGQAVKKYGEKAGGGALEIFLRKN